MNEPPVSVWVIATDNGSVEVAHCTCMAGLGEVCSHVGALLYTSEFVNSARTTTSCTDVRCLWKVPALSEVRSEQLKNIDFGRTYRSSIIDSSQVPPIAEGEFVNVLKKIEDVGSSSVLMRVVKPFASTMEIPSVTISNIFQNLYNEEYESLYSEQLIQLTGQYVQLYLTEVECTQIEEVTRAQAKSNEWFNQRAGRITASKLKQVCRTSLSKPSLSLIKQICYPLKFQFKTKATEWGIRSETKALQAYEQEMRTAHENVEIKTSGFNNSKRFATIWSFSRRNDYMCLLWYRLC